MDVESVFECDVFWLGTVEYAQAWALQQELARRRAAAEISDTLLLLEHPHVYTLGRSGHRENLVLSEEECARRGIDVHWVDRGGDITYHGPGQLVGYPILALGRPEDATGRLPQADYVGYIRRLEKALIDTLAHFGVASGQMPGKTGVWVQADVASRCPACPPEKRQSPSKIAAIGVKVNAAGISQHGFALNVSPQMEFWDGIIACGLQGYEVISLKELLGDEAPKVHEVAEAFVEEFGKVFSRHMASKPEAALSGIAGVKQAVRTSG